VALVAAVQIQQSVIRIILVHVC